MSTEKSDRESKFSLAEQCWICSECGTYLKEGYIHSSACSFGPDRCLSSDTERAPVPGQGELPKIPRFSVGEDKVMIADDEGAWVLYVNHALHDGFLRAALSELDTLHAKTVSLLPLNGIDISEEAYAWMQQFMPDGAVEPRYKGMTMFGVAGLLKTDLLERERKLAELMREVGR